MSYVIPIPLYAAEPKGFVVAHIDKERYQDIAIRIYQNSDFAVLDGDGTLIFSTMDGQREEELLSSLPDAAHETVEYGGGKYSIKETYSGVNSLRYISVTARDAAYQKLSHIRRMMLLAFGLCVLTGVLCAMYFSRKNYRPIKSVLNLLVKQKLLKTGGDAEEGQLLIDAIGQLVTSKNKMDQKLHQQRDYVRTSVLSKLINNGFSDALSAKRLESMCDLDLSRPCFAVLGFHIYEQDSGQTDVQEYEFRFLIVKNVFEELLNQRYTAYIAEINSVICGIVNFGPQEETAYRKDLRTIVECGQAAVLNNFGMELAIASSVVRRELASVPQCYSEAVTGIQNLVFQQSKDLLFYDSLLTENQSGYEYYFSFNREQRLIDCVKAGDAAGAKAIIGEMFEKYNDRSVASVNVIKCVISDVAAAIFKAACQVQGGTGGGIPAEISNPQNLDAGKLEKGIFQLCGFRVRGCGRQRQREGKQYCFQHERACGHGVQQHEFEHLPYCGCAGAERDLYLPGVFGKHGRGSAELYQPIPGGKGKGSACKPQSDRGKRRRHGGVRKQQFLYPGVSQIRVYDAGAISADGAGQSRKCVIARRPNQSGISAENFINALSRYPKRYRLFAAQPALWRCFWT